MPLTARRLILRNSYPSTAISHQQRTRALSETMANNGTALDATQAPFIKSQPFSDTHIVSNTNLRVEDTHDRPVLVTNPGNHTAASHSYLSLARQHDNITLSIANTTDGGQESSFVTNSTSPDTNKVQPATATGPVFTGSFASIQQNTSPSVNSQITSTTVDLTQDNDDEVQSGSGQADQLSLHQQTIVEQQEAERLKRKHWSPPLESQLADSQQFQTITETHNLPETIGYAPYGRNKRIKTAVGDLSELQLDNLSARADEFKDIPTQSKISNQNVEVVILTEDEAATPVALLAPQKARRPSVMAPLHRSPVALVPDHRRGPSSDSSLEAPQHKLSMTSPTSQLLRGSGIKPTRPSILLDPRTPKIRSPSPSVIDRHTPKSRNGTPLRDPSRFSVKPPIWNSWTAEEYSKLAEHLFTSFDHTAFATQADKPIEEVRDVLNAVVCRPLRHAVEAARRGKEGMQELFDLYNKWGTPVRTWGRKSRHEVRGELLGFKNGYVHLEPERGRRGLAPVPVKALTKDDLEYLERVVMDEGAKAYFRSIIEHAQEQEDSSPHIV